MNAAIRIGFVATAFGVLLPARATAQTYSYQVFVDPIVATSCEATQGNDADYRGLEHPRHGWSVWVSALWTDTLRPSDPNYCGTKALSAGVRPDGSVSNPHPNAIRITANDAVQEEENMCKLTVYDRYAVVAQANQQITLPCSIDGREHTWRMGRDTDVVASVYVGYPFLPPSQVEVSATHGPIASCSLFTCADMGLFYETVSPGRPASILPVFTPTPPAPPSPPPGPVSCMVDQEPGQCVLAASCEDCAASGGCCADNACALCID